MTRFNATVTTGFVNRAGEFVHWVRPDRGEPVQVKFHEALADGKRVRLENGRIGEVQ